MRTHHSSKAPARRAPVPTTRRVGDGRGEGLDVRAQRANKARRTRQGGRGRVVVRAAVLTSTGVVIRALRELVGPSGRGRLWPREGASGTSGPSVLAVAPARPSRIPVDAKHPVAWRVPPSTTVRSVRVVVVGRARRRAQEGVVAERSFGRAVPRLAKRAFFPLIVPRFPPVVGAVIGVLAGEASRGARGGRVERLVGRRGRGGVGKELGYLLVLLRGSIWTERMVAVRGGRMRGGRMRAAGRTRRGELRLGEGRLGWWGLR